MENIIKKAIEGGWKPWNYSFGTESERSTKEIVEVQEWEGNQKMVNIWHEKTGSDTGTKTVLAYEIIVCDPLFFQALGKACGWKTKMGHCGKDADDYEDKPCCHFAKQNCEWFEDGWLYHSLKFHEINLTEGWDKAVAYLEELMK